MTQTQQPEALRMADALEKCSHNSLLSPFMEVAAELRRQHTRIAELEDDLQFVERWAVHHGSKPSISAEEALSCIQHYPAIHEITKSYKDGKHPDTFNPYARIAELEAQLSAIGAGGVEPLRKRAAPQEVHPESIREGAPYDNPEFEQLARDMGVWGTAQSAVCAQFWLAATQPAAQGLELANCKGDKWLTVVYRDIQPGDESRTIGEHPKVSALSWSHALHDRDTAIAAQAKQGEQ